MRPPRFFLPSLSLSLPYPLALIPSLLCCATLASNAPTPSISAPPLPLPPRRCRSLYPLTTAPSTRPVVPFARWAAPQPLSLPAPAPPFLLVRVPPPPSPLQIRRISGSSVARRLGFGPSFSPSASPRRTSGSADPRRTDGAIAQRLVGGSRQRGAMEVRQGAALALPLLCDLFCGVFRLSPVL